jgi:hypothetical protein
VFSGLWGGGERAGRLFKYNEFALRELRTGEAMRTGLYEVEFCIRSLIGFAHNPF